MLYYIMIHITTVKSNEKMYTLIKDVPLLDQIQWTILLKKNQIDSSIHVNEKGSMLWIEGDYKYRIRDILQKEKWVK
jgi:hypothetical protein